MVKKWWGVGGGGPFKIIFMDQNIFMDKGANSFH